MCHIFALRQLILIKIELFGKWRLVPIKVKLSVNLMLVSGKGHLGCIQPTTESDQCAFAWIKYTFSVLILFTLIDHTFSFYAPMLSMHYAPWCVSLDPRYIYK
jgi:hypothetical protein